MSRSAQLWPGARMTAFLATHLRAEPGVEDALANRLAERLSKKINRMLVWDAEHPAPANDVDARAANAAATTSQPAPVAFDPFEFSIVVVLAKQGEDALLDKLRGIEDMAQLRAMATAQHLGLKPPLETAEAVRTAMVAGAKQRLADRRAAAS